MMKNYLKIFFVAAFAAFSLSLASCSDDDDDKESAYDKLLGTWEVAEVSIDGGVNYGAWPFEATGATFNADGTYHAYGYFGTGKGTWELKDKVLYTYVYGEVYAYYDVIELEKTACLLKMTISMPDKEEPMHAHIKCIKK